MEPATPAFDKIEFCAGMEWVLEALGIIRTVALTGNDLLSYNNTTDSVGLYPGFHND